jgi:dihydropteroate synthase
VTPDSFSDGGKFISPRRAVKHALEMAATGADIVDIGAESTRPGARRVGVKEQLRRLEPVLEALADRLQIPISIDTTSATVAARCLKHGAVIINDVTALSADARMAATIARFNAGVVLMHMKGTPRTMQRAPRYRALLPQILSYLRKARKHALQAGIGADQIIVDPGIGFGKTTAHNLEIVRRIGLLKELQCPVLIGPSRKSFIGNVLAVGPAAREFGTAASVAWATANGVDIIRVHDVRHMTQVVRMTEAIIGMNAA